jgi:hypothetical protein
MTDGNGGYELPLSGDAIIFVIKPSGWMVPLNSDNLPQFYYIHKPSGSPPLRYPGSEATGLLPASVDFPLSRANEARLFRVVVFGDVQVRTMRDVSFFAHDVVEELVGVDAAFGVTLGDIVHDNLPLFSTVNETVAQIGIPWFNVIGNHDLHKDALHEEFSDETFESVYGPTYYSFDYGRVHFVVLDNVFVIADDQVPPRRRILPTYGVDQIEFLRNDLSYVSKDRLVILLMHMPLSPAYTGYEPSELFELLCDRPYTFSLSAHLHRQEHVFLTQADGWCGESENHHLVHAATCGSIWSGAPDEFGIPHATMCCGTPNGYSIMTLDGGGRRRGFLPFSCATEPPWYSIEYKVARRPATYQMNIFAPECVQVEELDTTRVLVNVFAASTRSKVSMRVGAECAWMRMEPSARPDPLYAVLKSRENRMSARHADFTRVMDDLLLSLRECTDQSGDSLVRLAKEVDALASSYIPPRYRMPQPLIDSPHLWEAYLPEGLNVGTHTIEVRAMDIFGHIYTSCRSFRIEE